MRIALLADIHGNDRALRAVLANLPPVDEVLVVGDVPGYFPFFRQCLDALWAIGARFVLGNHEGFERGDLPRPEHPLLTVFAEHFQAWARREDRDWLSGLTQRLEPTWEKVNALVTHGSPWSLDQYIPPDYTRWEDFARLPYQLVILGHTHRPMLRREGLVMVINPGSVGQPRDDDPRASYALIDVGSLAVEFRRRGL